MRLASTARPGGAVGLGGLRAGQLMPMFAGSAAGTMPGRVPWEEVSEVGGQVAVALVGGTAWAGWLFLGRRQDLRG
jgi:hypothetical protein